jgi:hypothetical protein
LLLLLLLLLLLFPRDVPCNDVMTEHPADARQKMKDK